VKKGRMKIVICGLSITSSWGNGHATNYRGLVRGLYTKGHDVVFLERDLPEFAFHRDLPEPPYGRMFLYSSLEEFKDRFTQEIREADAVIVGSFVADGIEIGKWVNSQCKGITAFYDLDAPVTMIRLSRGEETYVSHELLSRYDVYLSSTGGPFLSQIQNQYSDLQVRALYCSVDSVEYFPEEREHRWDLGYLGVYSEERQVILERFLIQTAHSLSQGRFVVAGPQYPDETVWGENIERIQYLPPTEHRGFYNSMRFTLSLNRKERNQAGYSPSVRLFEAASCGTPIISDIWEGLECFFEIGSELLVASSSDEVLHILKSTSEEQRREIGIRARMRVLASHTSEKRAIELEGVLSEALEVNAGHRPKKSSWTLRAARQRHLYKDLPL